MEYRDFETDDYRLRFLKEGEDWVCRLPPSVMEMIETSVTHREAEPVCWIDSKELDMNVSTSVTKNKQFDGDIPLYTHSVKELSKAIEIIKDFQNSDVPPCKFYEDTYADGWMDACNEILWAIEEEQNK